MYDVVVVETKTRKIVSIVGRNMSESQASKREMTLISRMEVGPFFVTSIPHDENLKEGDLLPSKQ